MLTFIGYKQIDKHTDKPNLCIDGLNFKNPITTESVDKIGPVFLRHPVFQNLLSEYQFRIMQENYYFRKKCEFILFVYFVFWSRREGLIHREMTR